MLVWGIYHWRPRQAAFRADFCRSCQARRLSVLVRTLDVLHLFWVPVLPLGLWSRWFCGTCGRRPHQATRTRRGFTVAGAIVLLLLSAAAWVPLPEVEPWLVWTLRVGLPLLAVLAIRAALEPSVEADLATRLAEVAEFEGWECPLCGGQLFNAPILHCTRCGAEHRPLPAG